MAITNSLNTGVSSNADDFSNIHALPETEFHSAHSNVSAVSWAAIFAGASAAAALSLILLLLGAGLGLSSVSPWAQKGISTAAFGISTIIWLAVTQVLAAGMGGYLAGRLRTRWDGVHSDEVYFRDTAHGFLAWAVASLATAVILASAVGAIVNGGIQAAAGLTGGAATATVSGVVAAHANSANTQSDNNQAEMSYFVDMLFRKDTNTGSGNSTNALAATDHTAASAEVTGILLNAAAMEALPAADLSYISQLVSRHTGLTQQDAEVRVNEIYANMQNKARDAEVAAKAAADKARKVSIYTTLWLFVSLLMGAFFASLAATWGGRCRDA